MSEKNGASPEIGAVLQKILARLDVIEQREQQQDAIEALRGNSGRRGAAAVDGARVDASVDEPASDRGGPSSDASSVASAASTAAILVDSLGEPDPKNKNRKHFKFMDAVWTSAFMQPGPQSSLSKADAKHANLHIGALRALQAVDHFMERNKDALPPSVQEAAYEMELQLWDIQTELRFMVDEYAARSTKSAAAATIMLDAARARAGERAAGDGLSFATREVADIVALVSQKTAEEALRSLSSKSAAAGKDKDRADREADADDISKMQKEVAALRKDKKYANKTLDLCRKELKKHDPAWTPPKRQDAAGASTSTPKRGKKHSPATDVDGGGEE